MTTRKAMADAAVLLLIALAFAGVIAGVSLALVALFDLSTVAGIAACVLGLWGIVAWIIKADG